jgi:serine/threonine-protein kinase
MSIVYGAEHVRLGRMVALKLLSPALATDETFQDRFIRESQLAASLDHPNIIPIYDAGEAEGFLYIAMRHVEGPDLGKVLEAEGPLALGQALFYIEQVASALDQAHSQGLVHRDVKPANVLIARPSDRVYLTDFGVVKQTSSRGLTKTGFFLGTFEYAAPEQIEGRPVDGRTDLYALGCVLYECLSGKPPFLADTEASVIHAHLIEPVPTLTDARPDLPRALNDVIATAMAKSIDDRYSSCGELVRALRAAALGSTVSGEGRPAPTPTIQAPAGGGETILASAGPGAGPPTAGVPPAPAPGAEPGAAGGDGAPRGTRTVTFTTKRLAILGGILAALIAAGVIAGVLLSGGNGKSSAGTTGSMEMTTSGSGNELMSMLPSDVPASSCKEVKGEHPGAINTVNCQITTKAGEALYLHADNFKSRKYLYSTYKDHGVGDEKAQGGNPDPSLKKATGACTSIDWLGEGPWSHGAGEEAAGRRSCFLTPGSSKACKPTGAAQCSVIVWTLDISNLFVRAVLPSTKHRDLFTWWRFHAHLFG